MSTLKIHSMKIAIIGYGKMGKLIEEVALNRGHQITLVIDKPDWNEQIIKTADLAIEFSSPKSAVGIINKCLNNVTPIVVGTTGWYNEFSAIKEKCIELNGSLLTATNFSLGVNIFLEINRKLATLMNPNKQYVAMVKETHHTQKVDSPSGTAISIANDIIHEIDSYDRWKEAENTDENVLGIKAMREPDVPGTHSIVYESDVDKICIEHEAKNRYGFALGAVIAAEFLFGKKGVYNMKEVLGI